MNLTLKGISENMPPFNHKTALIFFQKDNQPTVDKNYLSADVMRMPVIDARFSAVGSFYVPCGKQKIGPNNCALSIFLILYACIM